MRLFTVAACVAATLATAPAFSLDRATTSGIIDRYLAGTLATTETVLVMGGASASRDATRTELQNICDTSAVPFDVYTADDTAVTSGAEPDFRVYSCRLPNPAPANIPAGLAGNNIVVFYRSEGGSVYGPGSLAWDAAVKQLRVVNTAACSDAATGFPTTTETCTITGYSIDTDTESTGRLINLKMDLAVSDVEPHQFRGVNWPTAGVLANLGEPNAGALEGTAPSGPKVGAQSQVFGQVFGIIVNSANPATSLSRQDIRSIFSGAYDRWSDVRAGADGTNSVYPAGGAIKLCRREAGSGTQASAEIYFMGQGCNAAPVGFLDEIFNPPSGDTVLQHNTTTAAMEACVNSDVNAIGINTFKTTPISGAANVKYVAIDGVSPSRQTAGLGGYDFWYETTFTRRNGLGGGNANDGRAALLATGLTTRAQQLSSVPNNAAVIALRLGGVNAFAHPLQSPTPVAYGTRGGNSCQSQVAGNSF